MRGLLKRHARHGEPFSGQLRSVGVHRSRPSLALLVATLLLFPATGSLEQQPAVAITSLADGDWVEGTVVVEIAAEGDFTQVELLANGTVVASGSPGDLLVWDTAVADATAPAWFTLVARASDGDGTQAESAPVSVTVLYPRQLTFEATGEGINLQPEWHPGGGQLVFKSNRGLEQHIYHIYTMAATGGDPVEVLTDRSYHGYPGWSPDGSRMVFNSYDPENGTTHDMDIFVVNLSSGESVQVTSDPAFDDSGRWSPNGEAISFHSGRDGSLDVWKIPVAEDGTPTGGPVQLTSSDASEHCPRWSFDGEWIVYQADRDEGTDIWVMRSNGSDARRVTDDPYYDGYPGWSPDGEWLVYDSERDGNKDLYLVPVEGGAQRRVTMDSGVDQHPSWSPDGRSLAFHSGRNGNLNLWIVEIPDTTSALAVPDVETSAGAGELLLPLVLGATAVVVALFLRRRSP